MTILTPLQNFAAIATQLAAAIGTANSAALQVTTDEAAVAAAEATETTDETTATNNLAAAQTLFDSLQVAGIAAGLVVNVPTAPIPAPSTS